MPALEQLNIRVTTDVKADFRERARREGLSQAALLEAMLKQRGPLPPLDPYEEATPRRREHRKHEDPDPTAPVQAADEERLDFPTWLQGRTGVPKALATRAISAGRVSVAGVPYTAQQIPAKLLKTTVVSYEGTEL